MRKVAELTLDSIFVVGLSVCTVVHVRRKDVPMAIASGLGTALWTSIFVHDVRK